MKTTLLSAAALFVALASNAQCTDLFISEYCVGTGNNKAYELYNPTDASINLDGYVLQRWSNGEGSSTDETVLAGTIPAYGTWVVTNGQTEDIDLGTFISPACDPALQALADQLDNPYPAPTYMNGDDALVLVNGSTVLDIFGKPGEDPGDGWSTEDGTIITAGHTMLRKPSIMGGVTMPPISFDPMAEWDTLGSDDWSNLGMHACECDPTLGITDRENLEVSVFPTISTTGEDISVKSNYSITGIEVFDLTGKKVESSYVLVSTNEGVVTIEGVTSGLYIVNVLMEGNVGFSTRIIKN